MKALLYAAALLAAILACKSQSREYHLSCPRCETAAERSALVDCLARSRVTPPADDEYGSTVRATHASCMEAVCPRRPTVCVGYAICGESYCQPEPGR